MAKLYHKILDKNKTQHSQDYKPVIVKFSVSVDWNITCGYKTQNTCTCKQQRMTACKPDTTSSLNF